MVVNIFEVIVMVMVRVNTSQNVNPAPFNPNPQNGIVERSSLTLCVHRKKKTRPSHPLALHSI